MKKIFRKLSQKLEVTPIDRANELMMQITFNSDTKTQIETFKQFELMFKNHLRNVEEQSAKECRLINGFLPKHVNLTCAKDPYFDKPLSEIETNYEIINAKK